MITCRLVAAAAACLIAGSPAKAAPFESDYRDRLCAGMAMERVLANGTRVDCMNDEFAIEVDFTNKWAEAIGQSLSYAAATGRRPGIILVCRPNFPEQKCLVHNYLIQEAAAHWRLPLTLWACPSTAQTLHDCRRRDLGIGG